MHSSLLHALDSEAWCADWHAAPHLVVVRGAGIPQDIFVGQSMRDVAAITRGCAKRSIAVIHIVHIPYASFQDKTSGTQNFKSDFQNASCPGSLSLDQAGHLQVPLTIRSASQASLS